MTSAARTIEQAASSIMSSLAQGLIAEISVGLIAAAVEVPVPEPEGDHIRRPDHAASGEQTARVSGEDLVVGQDLHDEPAGGDQVRQGQERDNYAGVNQQ